MISRRQFLAAAAVLPLAAPARAQLSVPYVPTPQVVVDHMLLLARVGAQDFVMDLGSGDGRILITAAAKFGARGLGVDLDDELLQRSQENATAAGVADRVKFAKQDLFKTDLAQATVVTMYLIPRVMRELKPKLLALKPGTRLVSHDFDLEDWQPDRKITLRKNIFLWTVPANVGGRWQLAAQLPEGERKYELDVRQKHQEVDGTVRADGRISSIWEPRLDGARMTFIIVDDRDREREAGLYFDGVVEGNTMQGELRRGVGSQQTTHKWRATRAAS